MTKQVITCSADTEIKEAARLMYLNGLSGLPVLDQAERVVGIITEQDLVKIEGRLHLPLTFAFLGSLIYLDDPLNGDEIEKQLRALLATKVADLMTKEVVTIPADASLEDLAEIFLQKKINLVPVVADGKLVGIISRADIVKLIAGDKELWENQWKELVKKS